MADDLVISAAWLEGIKKSLDQVQSAGQAGAAVQSAVAFAGDVSSELTGGFWSWLTSSDTFGDPWRSAADKQIIDAQREVQALDVYYAGASTAPVGVDWPNHRQKIFNLYTLAEVIRQGYPADTDASRMTSTLLGGASDLATEILTAPKVLLQYAGDLGKEAIHQAAGIVDEAAKGVNQAAKDLIPWPLVGGAVLVVGGLIVGIVYMAKAGVKVPGT